MATIQITDKHRREMSPERDFPAETPVSRRYAILSSPRSGSTLLGRILHATKMAGDPQEYFNPPLLVLERQRSGNEKLSLGEFLRSMEKRRTSPNGVFGMKLHHYQMLGAFNSRQVTQPMLNFLKKKDKLIWMRRRDRIGQAISQAVALKTNVWSSEDSRFSRNPDVAIHPYETVAALNTVARDDASWELLLQRTKLPVLEVWYEDLVEDYENQARNVLRYLEIDKDVPDIPPPPLERQGGELNERLRREVHAYLGLPLPAA